MSLNFFILAKYQQPSRQFCLAGETLAGQNPVISPAYWVGYNFSRCHVERFVKRILGLGGLRLYWMFLGHVRRRVCLIERKQMPLQKIYVYNQIGFNPPKYKGKNMGKNMLLLH